MKDKYKDVKDSNSKSGNAPVSFPFYDLIDNVLGHREAIDLTLILESTKSVSKKRKSMEDTGDDHELEDSTFIDAVDTYDPDDDFSADKHPADGSKVAKQSDASDVKMKNPKKIGAFNTAREDAENHHTGDNKSKSYRGKKLTQQEKIPNLWQSYFNNNKKVKKRC